MRGDAILSPDGRFRWLLTREWEPQLGSVAFVMLNPSTADAATDDPTVRRCVGFARDAGFGSLAVVNLFGVRLTRPKPPSGWTRQDVGPDGRSSGWSGADLARLTVVCAWGAGAPHWRVAEALAILGARRLLCLGTTALGHPRHPLYVPAAQRMVPWDSPSTEVRP